MVIKDSLLVEKKFGTQVGECQGLRLELNRGYEGFKVSRESVKCKHNQVFVLDWISNCREFFRGCCKILKVFGNCGITFSLGVESSSK